MYDVSQRYLDTLGRPHDQVSSLDVLQDGSVVASLAEASLIDPNSGGKLLLLGGSVSVSSTTIRRSASIQLLDTVGTLTPTDVDDLLAPYRTELRVWIGVRYWDSLTETELVPAGTLVITQPAVGNRVLTLQCYDRMWHLGNFPEKFTLASGTFIDDAINQLLAIVVPNNLLQTAIPNTEYEIIGDHTWAEDSSIADAVHHLARTAGWKIACDPMGVFTAYTPPNTNDDPDLVLQPGQGTLLTAHPQRSLGGGDVNNAVIVTNQGGNNRPVRGYAQDNNPRSLTNVDAIGVRPVLVNYPYVSTPQQADLAAVTHLRSILGLADQQTLEIMPNHALDVDDVISVTDPSMGLSDVRVIADNFTIGLRGSDGPISIGCRSHVVVAGSGGGS